MSGKDEILLKIENLRAFHRSKDGLVRAINDVSFAIERGERLQPIPGRPPSLIDLPSGCPFNTRCSKVEAICKTQRPEYKEVAPVHRVFCHMV